MAGLTSAGSGGATRRPARERDNACWPRGRRSALPGQRASRWSIPRLWRWTTNKCAGPAFS